MRKIVFILILGIMSSVTASARKNARPDEIVWFGLDYSMVKFIGFIQDFSDMDRIQNYYFRNWNELILAESKKYNLFSAFGVKHIDYRMEKAIEFSEKRSMEGILQREPYSITEAEVVDLVQSYKDPAVQKTGAVFIMETLNKMQQKATIWAVSYTHLTLPTN